MGVFSFLHTTKPISAVLIDIGAASVAGACVVYEQGALPTILYTRRVPIANQGHESADRALLRALRALVASLITEGSPLFMRVTGRGSTDKIFVSIDAPWEVCTLRTEQLEEQTPFVFSRHMLDQIVRNVAAEAPADAEAHIRVAGTILNGYPTDDPFGQEVHRASILLLVSHINRAIGGAIREVILSQYHTDTLDLSSGTSLRLAMLEEMFPHESEYLSIDASAPVSSLALVRGGRVRAIRYVRTRESGESWATGIAGELAKIAGEFPLPRTVFLLAKDSDAQSFAEMLRSRSVSAHWIRGAEPTIIPLVKNHWTHLLRYHASTHPDLSLILTTLYAAKQWKT